MGYYGLNHLGWLYRLESGGRDVLPDLLANTPALQSFEEGRLFPQPFLARLGMLPNEYLYYYYRRDAARQAMQAMAQTRGESIHSQQQELYPRLAAAGPGAYRLWEEARLSREEGYLAEARGAGERRNEEDLAGGGYERVALAAMRALAGGGDTQLILNTRNALSPAGEPAAGNTPERSAPVPAPAAPGVPQPAIPGLPPDAVVEVPCTVTPAGAAPLPQQAPARTAPRTAPAGQGRGAAHGPGREHRQPRGRWAGLRPAPAGGIAGSGHRAAGRLRAGVSGAREDVGGQRALGEGVVFYRMCSRPAPLTRAGGRKEVPWH